MRAAGAGASTTPRDWRAADAPRVDLNSVLERVQPPMDTGTPAANPTGSRSPTYLIAAGRSMRRDDGGMERFVDDDPGYLDWLARHPDGFVVNTGRTPTAAYLMLHRAGCGSTRLAGSACCIVEPPRETLAAVLDVQAYSKSARQASVDPGPGGTRLRVSSGRSAHGRPSAR